MKPKAAGSNLAEKSKIKTPRGVKVLILSAILLFPFMALGATQTPDDPSRLLSSDSFGVCVPQENLVESWLVLVQGANLERIPHVCMSGDCDNLPDIATWASAQQFPEDTDLNSEDVQEQYAAFVGHYCEALLDDVPEVDLNEPDESDVNGSAPATAVPAVQLEAPSPAPLINRAAPALFTSQQFNNTPAPFMPMVAPRGGSGGLGGFGTSSFNSDEADPPQDLSGPIIEQDSPGLPLPPDSPQLEDEPPLSVVPLPATMLLLLSALGLLRLMRNWGRNRTDSVVV